MYLYYFIIYLGFFTAATASVMVMVSGMKKVLEIFDRSQWHLRGSPRRPMRAESGSSLYNEGTGPASRSPSKRSASRGQVLRSTTSRLSLKYISFKLVLNLFPFGALSGKPVSHSHIISGVGRTPPPPCIDLICLLFLCTV